ncbi:J517_1871 family lipoprotein [Gilliamella sp. Nev3-1]|uniref:J517_1871 family lipoprotein n=1 Tax=Gilliamella sp. Nev3-1 TaxID=3120250 RepID=UPI0009BE3D0E|nr:J517_1871 family lipoprotein [Gilliamella apicola]
MKKLMSVGVVGFLLAGCATISDANGEDFITAKKVNPQSSMIGFWVGASGPYLNTWKINNDGTGEFCYSWNGKNVNGKLIFNGKEIIYQSGEKLEITDTSGSVIEAKSYYYGTTKYKFYKDDNLTKSSTFCQNLFNK